MQFSLLGWHLKEKGKGELKRAREHEGRARDEGMPIVFSRASIPSFGQLKVGFLSGGI